jgi:uncharacterized protein YidB (DUF937 family)
MDDLAGALNKAGRCPTRSGCGWRGNHDQPHGRGRRPRVGHRTAGRIDAVLNQLRSAGYGQQVDSWISTDENQTIPPQQLGAALGDEKVQQLSASSGISIGQLLPLLAAFLPTIVNMLTPHGTTPAGGVNQAAANSGPDLGGLLGGILGGLGGASGGAGGQAACPISADCSGRPAASGGGHGQRLDPVGAWDGRGSSSRRRRGLQVGEDLAGGVLAGLAGDAAAGWAPGPAR